MKDLVSSHNNVRISFRISDIIIDIYLFFIYNPKQQLMNPA